MPKEVKSISAVTGGEHLHHADDTWPRGRAREPGHWRLNVGGQLCVDIHITFPRSFQNWNQGAGRSQNFGLSF